MRILILATAAVAFAVPVTAHPGGHDMGMMTERQPVDQLAKAEVIRLVTQSKLPASWGAVVPESKTLRVEDGTQQWVVTFTNDAIQNTAKRTLYVVMTTSGAYVSAGHSAPAS